MTIYTNYHFYFFLIHTFGAAAFSHSLAWSSQSILHAVAKSLFAFSHSPNNLKITTQDKLIILNFYSTYMYKCMN